MRLVPNSDGRPLREFNPCHEPGGTHYGGQFAAKGEGKCGPARGTTRVGITSARTPGDPLHRPNKVVAEEMRVLDQTLRRLPGVRHVSVKPALGQWKDGSEFSWAVSYVGNGEARQALARVGQRWNQDAILILRTPNRGEEPDAAHEIEFQKPVGLAARKALADVLSTAGFGGWTWFKRSGRTTLRVASVPQWGGDNATHATALKRVLDKFRSAGLQTQVRELRVKTEVYEREGREGVPGYAEVLGGKT